MTMLRKVFYCLCGTATAVSVALSGPEALGQCSLDTSTKILAEENGQPDGEAGDLFGHAVAISGNTAVVGAYNDDYGNKTDAGAAYVYTYNTAAGVWEHTAKLTASDSENGDLFGYSVAIDGDLIVVGAPYQDTPIGGSPVQDAGAAYVFRLEGSTWVEKQKLWTVNANPTELFGWDVDVHNTAGDDLIVSGVPEGNDGYLDKGYAVVFRSTDQGESWTEEDTLGDEFGSALDYFGHSVAVRGDLVFAAAPNYGTDNGRVYEFRRIESVWTKMPQVLTGPNLSHYGYSVDTNGDVLVVGCEVTELAYVYTYNGSTWDATASLSPANPSANDNFGYPVALDGDLILVGANGDDVEGDEAGAVYCFGYDGEVWREGWKMTASDADDNDYFGSAVALSGGFAIVGVPGDDDAGSLSGSAHLFSMVMDDCNENSIPDECDIEHGYSNDCDANGIPDECQCWMDIDDNGYVDIDDVFAVLGNWGPCDDPEDCPADVGSAGYGCPDGTVDIDDLFCVLGFWGPCSVAQPQTPPQSVMDCILQYASDPEALATCIEAMQIIGAGQ